MLMKLTALLICIGGLLHFTSGQVNPELYKTLRSEFNETNAYNTVAFVEQRWRLPGNSGFNESIYHVEQILKMPASRRKSRVKQMVH